MLRDDNSEPTDAGLAHLAKMKKLEILRLETVAGYQFSFTVIEDLKKSLPGCEVWFSERIAPP
jgi:hypothetical protein